MATEKYTIKFTAHARKDLDSIFGYISKELYAPQAVGRIMKMIHKSRSDLSGQPFIAPVINDELLARKGLRKLVVEDYIILYKVQNTAGNVLIYRIVNGRTNYMSFFTSKNG